MAKNQAYTFKTGQETLPPFSWNRPDEEVALMDNFNSMSDEAQDSYDLDKAIAKCHSPLKGYEDLSEPDLLKALVRTGMKTHGYAGKKEYEERVEFELEIILAKGFERYFLIIWDIMWFCRRNGIMYGLGRGSGASSLVGHCLKITGIDPIKHNLLFARFLDYEREDYPDYDLDIQDNRRIEIKEYMIKKYGEDRVAGIATFEYFSEKSAFKAAGRILDVPFAEMNKATKIVNSYEDIEIACKTIGKPGMRQLAQALYGRLSGTGRHAAGVVVTDKPITEYVSVESRTASEEGKSREPVVAVDKNIAEEIGLIKIDLLGLVNLSIIDTAAKIVKKTQGKSIDWKALEPDDPKVFKMLSDGHTSAVFQAEQSASTNLILEMGVNNFDELVTSNALVRSGAYNAFGPDYIATKKGKKKTKYPTEKSKEFLEDSLGFAVMQEQSMLICEHVAGMSVGDANLVRKLTAKKKDKSTLAPFKDKFIQGCIGNGVSNREAEKLWSNLETTAEYQFNKCLAHDTTVEEITLGKITVEELFKYVNGGGDARILGPEVINGASVEGKVYHKVLGVYDSGKNATMRIMTSSDSYIDATLNHKHRLSKRWKEAYRIHHNDPIWTEDGKKKVTMRRYAGIQQTYDVELETEPHAFYANGFVTHNSHAVSYSMLSYACAYFKYYFPGEYMTAVLTHTSDPAEVSSYLAECKRLGLQVNPPDVNKSDKHYAYKDGQIYMGLSSVKFISDKLAERLIAARGEAGFQTYEELEAKVYEKGSGLNSRMLGALKAVGSVRLPGIEVNERESKSNFYEYLGIPSFDDVALSSEVRSRVTAMKDYDEAGSQVLLGIVQKVVSKNGWNRAEVIDAESSASFFMDNADDVIKGQRYLMLVSKNSLIDKVNLSDYDGNRPMVKWLEGRFESGTYIVWAKTSVTKNGKTIATIVYSHDGELRYCMAFGQKVALARSTCSPGKEVRLAVGDWKGTPTFEHAKRV